MICLFHRDVSLGITEKRLGLIAEAHPDVIGEDGIASEEAYKKDLAYLKEKVGAYHKFTFLGVFFPIPYDARRHESSC